QSSHRLVPRHRVASTAGNACFALCLACLILRTPFLMKLLTLARDLRRRKARERQGLFIAEGIRTVEELSRSSLEIRGLLTGPGLADNSRGTALVEDLKAKGIPVDEVDHREFESAAETESPQGILAVAV